MFESGRNSGIFHAFIVGACAIVSASFAAVQPTEVIHFYQQVKPILSIHCLKCHGPETQKSGLRLDAAQHALAGGDSGPAIVPEASSRSELIRRIRSNAPDEQMPPKGPRLSEHEVRLLTAWIDQGAVWPARDEYWAFLPAVPPAVPSEPTFQSSRNPIDRFLDTKLKSSGIQPLSQAPPRILLRRAYADLLGVPPSPDEADSFLRDRSPEAFEKLVDRLLADPRYGERWARHWLDLARYAESDGYEDDKIRPHAWRYRDYVIHSFNSDQRYDRFVQEQIAGDELWPNDPQSAIATGFLRLGSWDAMSKEPARQRQEFLNDATDAAGSVFLGVTLGCARCHDHKYDLISQRDYYRVQSFFIPVQREIREIKRAPFDSTAVAVAYQEDTARIKQLQAERDSLLSAARAELERARQFSATNQIADAEVAKKAESLRPGILAPLNARLKELEAHRRLRAPRAEVASGSPKGAVRGNILKGGEVTRPGDSVEPGFIEAMLSTNPCPTPGSKRTDLANWITSPEHPLFSRVFVNRLWQHHFGIGLVATPSDFGRNGKQPVQRDLLDWLATRFAQENFSVKQMHRLMMTSAAYRRASSPSADAMSRDPENILFWRMNRRRLEGESIRDTILAVSGQLHLAMGGPGVYARLPKDVVVELPNNDKELSWGVAEGSEKFRRSIYLFQRRSLTYPMLDVFDAAPMNQTCPARAQTTVAPQALALFNGEFAREAAGYFAARLSAEAGKDPNKRLDRAFQLAFSRAPSKAERAFALRFLATQTARRHGDPNPESAAWIDFCHVLLNANELIYID